MNKLFDEMNRDDTGPKDYSKPEFDYLNRSARLEVERIRNLLEKWFEHFPSENQDDLRARFRSKDERQHLGSFFELYLHELLFKSGFTVEIHPTAKNKGTRPDFKVLKDGKPLFYLEATLAAWSDEEMSSQARKNQVYDAIDQMNSPNFLIDVEVDEAAATIPAGAKIRRFLENKLSNLDPDLIAKLDELGGEEALPHWRWEKEGWRITFIPIPKKPEARGEPGLRPIGMVESAVCWITPHKGIKNSIKNKKASNYGKLDDLPYVIAINAINEFGVNDSDISNALFGRIKVTVITRGNEIIGKVLGRKPDGAWYGPKGPQNRRVSAVLIAVNLTPWTIATVTPSLWHNPWAEHSLALDILPLPQLTLDLQNRRMGKHEGKNGWQLLGLHPKWPFMDE